MTTVLTYGIFDLLDLGHVRLLRRLKVLGDTLTQLGISAFFNENLLCKLRRRVDN